MDHGVTQVQGMPPEAVPTETGDALSTGTTIGEVRLGVRVAAGLSSEIFRGDNTLTGKPCAVKVVRRALGAGVVASGRYAHEAQQVSSLGIAEVGDVYSVTRTSRHQPLAMMAWQPGSSLGSLIDEHAPIPAQRALPLARALCAAVSAVHARGFAHRRLHGGNVMVAFVEGAPQVRIVDWGVWHLHPRPGDSCDVQRSAEHALCLAPEIIRGGEGDARSDVYALGVLLYALLTGHYPIVGETFAEVTERHLSVAPEPLTSPESIPAQLQGAILKALEKDPKQRTPSAEALLGAIDPLWASTTGQHHRPHRIRELRSGEFRMADNDRPDPSPAGRVATPVAPIASTETLKPPRRKLGLFVALGATFAIFVGAVAWMLLDTEETPPAAKSPPHYTARRPPAKPPARPPKRRPGAQPKVQRPPAQASTPPASAEPAHKVVRGQIPRPRAGATVPLDRVQLAAEAKHGTLILTAGSPQAAFFLDGKMVGRGQRRTLRRVPIGPHRVHVVINGQPSPVRTISLTANKTLSLSF